MADTSLGDMLAGIAGRPVNRPGLEAFVANSQSINGLRSAQTEDALAKAQDMRDQQEAKQRVKGSLGAYLHSINDPHPDEHAEALGDLMAAHYGNDFKESEAGMKDALHNSAFSTVIDPHADPNARLAADQGLNPGANPVQAVEGQLIPRFAPNTQGGNAIVQQTPVSQATIAEKNATAHQKMAAGSVDPTAVDVGAYQYYKTGVMPPLGMGSAAMRAQILSGAAKYAQQESETGNPVMNNAYDAMIRNGQDFKGSSKTIQNFDAGPESRQIRASNNIIGHLGLYDEAFRQLQNGSFRPGNALDVAWQHVFGKPAPTTLQSAASIIGPELLKSLVVTGAGTGPEREHFAELAGNLANSPEQVTGATGMMRNMLARQLQDYELQYKNITGRDDFRKKYLASDVQGLLKQGDKAVVPSGTAAPGAGAATPGAGAAMSLDEYLKKQGF